MPVSWEHAPTSAERVHVTATHVPWNQMCRDACLAHARKVR